jgi:hypothetical protein
MSIDQYKILITKCDLVNFLLFTVILAFLQFSMQAQKEVIIFASDYLNILKYMHAIIAIIQLYVHSIF